MNVIAWLRTPIATLIVLCAALLSQMPHAADVFRLLVAGEGIWATVHGYAYAVALELAVLLFVVQRRNAESYVFAGVSILVNLSYYALHGTNLFVFAALPAWLVSIALPAAIARYSHLLVESPATQPHADAQQPAAPATQMAKPATKTPVAPVAPDVADDALGAIAQQDARTVALQMADEGCSVAQIAAQVNAKPATVRSWIARDRARRNGGITEVHP